MKPALLSRIVVAAALACLLLLGACSDDSVSPKPEARYKELTDKENVIYNLVQSYKYCSIEEYTKLLHADYIWNNQAEYVQNGGEPFWTRAQDITQTGNMFAAKLGTHPDPNKKITTLNLHIYSASWQELSDIGGVPCTDCWLTTRPYQLELYMPAIDMTYISNDHVAFYVVAVQANNRTEYRIYRADDINDPQTP